MLAPAAALGFFDGLVPIWSGSTLHQVRAERHIAATGSIEQPLMFDGNDLPGVMLCSGAERLATLYGVRPGDKAVVATTGDRGLEAALALHAAGVTISAVVDARPRVGPTPSSPRSWSGRASATCPGPRVVRAFGRKQVRAWSSPSSAPTATPNPDTERGIDCDLVAVSRRHRPGHLAAAAGRAPRPATTRPPAPTCPTAPPRASTSPEPWPATPARARPRHPEPSPAPRRRCRWSWARPPTASGWRPTARRWPTRAAEAAGRPRPRGGGKKCFACICEDVTTKDITYSVEEGYDSIELSKRYTTLTMGPCQGRMCQLPSIRKMAEDTGVPVADVGLTTARPPWSTVPMGAMAGRPFEPAKRSAVHGRHRELGGNVMWAGDWRRAYDYGDPEAETMAVHEGAGLIDVSTLGKLMVRGKDAGEFLNRLYPNRFDNLKPGRIRYGVLGDDAGRITDDGTLCRLDDDTFYVTTTSSGADAVEAWFAWWLAEWKLDVHLTDVSQGLSAFNLAGPEGARDPVGTLTDLDCSNDGFAYLDGKRAHVAGVPCLMLRIGFVGELGYELHCPGSLAQDLWDALMAAGEPHGIRPFGLEPQRVLRLQKLHILVGQDTDAESNPLEAAMPWIVKFDKDQDFIGRWALENVAGARQREEPGRLHDGQRRRARRGRRRSSRTATARRAGHLGPLLAPAPAHDRDGWVPADLSEDGTPIDGRRQRAPPQRQGARPPPSTTPTRRSCADELRVPRTRRGVSPRTGRRRCSAARSSGRTWTRARSCAERAGWNVVSDYGDPDKELAACRDHGRRRRPLLPGQVRASGRPGDGRLDRLGPGRRRDPGAGDGRRPRERLVVPGHRASAWS